MTRKNMETQCQVSHTPQRDAIDIYFYRYWRDDDTREVGTEKATVLPETGELVWQAIDPGALSAPTLTLDYMNGGQAFQDAIGEINRTLVKRVAALENWQAQFQLYAEVVIEQLVNPQERMTDVIDEDAILKEMVADKDAGSTDRTDAT